MTKKMDTPHPSEKLHQAARAGFVMQGTTLAKWCKSHHVSHTNARQALLGTWAGPAGKKLLKKIVKESHAIEITALQDKTNDK